MYIGLLHSFNWSRLSAELFKKFLTKYWNCTLLYLFHSNVIMYKDMHEFRAYSIYR